VIAHGVVHALGRDPLSDAPLGDALSDELQTKYLVWDAFVGGRRRVDLHPLVLSPAMHRAAVRAAEGVARVVDRVADRAFDDEAEAARYRFHADVLRLARASHRAGDRSALARVDLLLDENGHFRACEINADCPGGHNESVALPRLARRAGFTLADDPSFVVDALVDRLAELARAPDGSIGAVALVYATAYAEDLQVCAFVQRALVARGVEALLVSATSFVFDEGVLFAAGVPVRAVYRFFPTEWMVGARSVGALEAAIEQRAVRTLSSFSRMFAQSKLAFARATAANETADGALPDTFALGDVPAERLVAERASWVVKRVLGRVGDQVFVGALTSDGDWRALCAGVTRNPGEIPWIAQRFVPQRPISTPFGDRYLTLGAYVLDGRFVGYFARITPSTHVSHDALCVPVFVGRREVA